MLPIDTLEHTEPGESPAAGLFFQRCLWCGMPAYRRSFCRACGSVTFRRERSAGDGIVLRRHGHVPHNTWFVAMNEGFNLLCRATGTVPVTVGSRVSVVGAASALGQDLPAVAATCPPSAAERWW